MAVKMELNHSKKKQHLNEIIFYDILGELLYINGNYKLSLLNYLKANLT